MAYLLHRYGQSKEVVKDSLSQLFSIIEILDVDSSDCIGAVTSDMTDFEDAVLAECAKRHCADFIISRNPKDYILSDVPCLVPLDFVERFGS